MPHAKSKSSERPRPCCPACGGVYPAALRGTERERELTSILWELYHAADRSPDGATIRLTPTNLGTKNRLWNILNSISPTSTRSP